MVFVLNVRSGLLEFQLLPESRQINHLALSRDGRTLAGIARDNTLRVWHVATARELLTLSIGCRVYLDFSFVPDDSALVVSGLNWHDRGEYVVLECGKVSSVVKCNE